MCLWSGHPGNRQPACATRSWGATPRLNRVELDGALLGNGVVVEGSAKRHAGRPFGGDRHAAAIPLLLSRRASDTDAATV